MDGMYIGDYRAGNGGRNFDGYIDEMAVFSHEPTAEVIAGLYDGTYTPATAPADAVSASGINIVDPMWTLTNTIAFDNPSGLAVSPLDGKLYAGRHNSLASDGGVYRIESDGSATLIGAGDRPAAIAIDPSDGDIFFSEDNLGNIHRVAADGSSVTTWVSDFNDDGLDDDPVGVAIVPDTFDGGTGSLVQPGDALTVDRGSGGFEQILLWSPDSSENEQVLHEDTDVADGVGSILKDPLDIVVSDSQIFVADEDANKIYTVDPTDGSLTELITSETIGGPLALAINPTSGDLVVLSDTSSSASKVLSIDLATGNVSTLVDSIVDVPGWANLAFSADGTKLYIGEAASYTIYELTAVPEPGTLAILLSAALASMFLLRRRP